MFYARAMSCFALAASIGLAACTDDPTSPVRESVAADYEGRPPIFNRGCNGDNASQLSTTPPTVRQPQLERVIVYGSPVQRPYRGFGDLESYGGVTQTFIYDRNMLDQCSFGTDNTFEVGGAVEDDTLDVPIEAPDGIEQEVWDALTPRVKKQLREAAWYLADHWVPNDIPGLGLITKEARRGLIFAVLARGYMTALERSADRRRETTLWHESSWRRGQPFTYSETLRLDALVLGCSTIIQFRELRSWNVEQAEEYASRVVAAWGADRTQNGANRYLETQLSNLGAIGAQMGRNGDTCAQAARYHFSNRPTDLYDPVQPGGRDEFLF
jgi:hypothetical protein